MEGGAERETEWREKEVHFPGFKDVPWTGYFQQYNK